MSAVRQVKNGYFSHVMGYSSVKINMNIKNIDKVALFFDSQGPTDTFAYLEITIDSSGVNIKNKNGSHYNPYTTYCFIEFY